MGNEAVRTFATLTGRYRRQCDRANHTRMRVRKRVDDWVIRFLKKLEREGTGLPDETHFTYEVDVEPTELAIGIIFWLKAQYPLSKKGREHEKDLQRAQRLYRCIHRRLERELRSASGLPVGMDVRIS